MGVCGLLLAAGLAGGMMRLFALRFSRGDVYPPYSTLRSDPLGTSVFYESLDRVPGLTAHRCFERTFKENDGQERTLMILGSEPFGLEELPRAEFNTLQQFVYSGGRLVLAYLPEACETPTTRTNELFAAGEKKSETKKGDAKPRKQQPPSAKPDPAAGDKKKSGDQPAKDEPEDDRRGLVEYASLQAEWGFRIQFQDLTTNEDEAVVFPKARLRGPSDGLPPTLVFHTALYFANLTNGWRTVYEREQLPVMAERRLGKGSVLLVADSYCFSNEAMLKNREAGLLAWVIGGGREVIFDEAHLGVLVDPGVASLLRKYHLHGLFFSLLLLAGLFVWKNSTCLTPPHEGPEEGVPQVAGRDAMSGFINLLRRGLPRGEVMNRIFEEWQKTSRRSSLKPEHRREIETLMEQENARPGRQRRPVAAYRAISAILQRHH
jgi:hypothetical protein